MSKMNIPNLQFDNFEHSKGSNESDNSENGRNISYFSSRHLTKS